MAFTTHGRTRWLSLPLILLAVACGSRPAERTRDSSPGRTALFAPGATSSQSTPIGQEKAPIHALVELTERPTAQEYGNRLAVTATVDPATDGAAATAAALQQLGRVRSEQSTFASRVASAQLPATGELFRLQRIYNGIVYVTDAAGVARLRAMPGARAVHVITPQQPDNAWTMPFVGVPQLWSNVTPLHGENVRIGVIDTGIDYTHANFGGPGTAAAYGANDPNLVEAGSFPTAKVVGGWDFAGADYDARFAATSYPMPDADPLDGPGGGHGSHVAGTIAGFGVNANGGTFTGTYDQSLPLATMKIGPGAAPKAGLYALKVFGDNGGSTALAALAMEWATDPNGDGDFSDHLDVVNLSLGSGFGTSADAEAAIYSNAVAAGVSVVASAGNSGDFYFVTGAPASTPEVISVAASGHDVNHFPALRVNSPAAVAGDLATGLASPCRATGHPAHRRPGAGPERRHGQSERRLHHAHQRRRRDRQDRPHQPRHLQLRRQGRQRPGRRRRRLRGRQPARLRLAAEHGGGRHHPHPRADHPERRSGRAHQRPGGGPGQRHHG